MIQFLLFRRLHLRQPMLTQKAFTTAPMQMQAPSLFRIQAILRHGVGSSPYTVSSGATDSNFYAAGLCTQPIDTYSDWYLPAICEMGYGSSACGSSSAPTLQNIQKSLIDSSGLSSIAGNYWSSTEVEGFPQGLAWLESFAWGSGSVQDSYNKGGQLGVRCSRALTL